MFIGHFGLALAAKRVAPRTSLGTLVAASELVDLAWPVLVLAGVERVRIAPGTTAMTPLDFESYPWTHSALLAVAWAVAFALVYRRRTGYRVGAWTVGALVFSHWVLDLVTHRPDLALWPAGPKVGLGLWNSVPGTLAVEVAIFLAGTWLYATATRPRTAAGRWVFTGFVVFLLVAYLGNVFGAPPPSADAVALVGILGGAVLVAWAWWADRLREPRPGVSAGTVPVP